MGDPSLSTNRSDDASRGSAGVSSTPMPLSVPALGPRVSMPVVVAIDGPAGTGKSTLCEALAERLGGAALHTGRHYRSVTLAAVLANVAVSDEPAVAALLDSQHPALDQQGKLVLEGRTSTLSELESPSVDTLVSAVSNNDAVRAKLITLQRAWVLGMIQAGHSVVIEGRDACTQIAPEARFRFYLNASIEERNARRSAQRDTGLTIGCESESELTRRDSADQGHGRTTPETPGVAVIDTDGSPPVEVFERLWRQLCQPVPPDQR